MYHESTGAYRLYQSLQLYRLEELLTPELNESFKPSHLALLQLQAIMNSHQPHGSEYLHLRSTEEIDYQLRARHR